ncbi:MAG: YhdH/YhfP family quinone oxidoreductase [Sulfurospirillaceae bacterium]|nr:YhdH/YhfP family quinone oxidoreductase [Sulfurospirillaceae bacterium]MDD2825357.1 YhdH/YhfP family quinone oxidoreductase [Sulfurospirillaceae bacterium]
MTYRALRVEEIDGQFISSIKELSLEALDVNDVLIRIKYAALNYKDALSCIGNKGVTKNYPHTPGIDGAGVVVRSNCEKFSVGDEVIVTSFDLGMNTDGAFSQFISVPKEWIIPLPKTLNLKEAVAIGTAGLTAAIGAYKLLANGQTKGNSILITGASGAVGSFCVKLFASIGFKVIALSSRADNREFLLSIGANEVILKSDFEMNKKKPLLSPQYDAAIDVVGGEILENILKQIKPEGSIAICGLVASPNIQTTVFPFILRGINLLGINSVEITQELRQQLWHKLANEWKIDLNAIIHEHTLDEIPCLVNTMLAGKITGRGIIKL